MALTLLPGKELNQPWTNDRCSRDLRRRPADSWIRGDVFLPGTPGYDEKRVQYAASSYPERMRPYLIAVPGRDSDDVPAAIRFAKANKKYLVARSGGHQYSGLSSGGEDTILLSMERFKHLEIKTTGGKTVARVGTGMLLTTSPPSSRDTGSPSRMESVPTSLSADTHSPEGMAT
jgi:FAD binding domain